MVAGDALLLTAAWHEEGCHVLSTLFKTWMPFFSYMQHLEEDVFVPFATGCLQLVYLRMMLPLVQALQSEAVNASCLSVQSNLLLQCAKACVMICMYGCPCGSPPCSVVIKAAD